MLLDFLWLFFKLIEEKKGRSNYVGCVFTKIIKPLMMFSSSRKRSFLTLENAGNSSCLLKFLYAACLNICLLFVFVIVVHTQCMTKESVFN